MRAVAAVVDDRDTALLDGVPISGILRDVVMFRDRPAKAGAHAQVVAVGRFGVAVQHRSPSFKVKGVGGTPICSPPPCAAAPCLLESFAMGAWTPRAPRPFRTGHANLGMIDEELMLERRVARAWTSICALFATSSP